MDRFRDPAVLAHVLGDWMAGEGVLYRRLASAIQAAVVAGELTPAARLPSERALAQALALSRSTVVAAYDELRGAGVVESRRGSGTRVASGAGSRRSAADTRLTRGRATSIIRRFDADGTDVISMKYAVDPGAPELEAALLDVVDADLAELLGDVGYHPQGLPALRRAIADHYTERGLETSPEQVLVTTGAHQAIALTAHLFLHPGSTVLVESPSWPGCFDAFSAVGARVVGIGMDEEGIRPDLLREALDAGPSSLVFVMPTFHNPTGTLMSTSRRREIARLTARHAVPVLEDNAYTASAGHQEELPPPIGAFATPDADVLTVGSMSKAVWGGLRIGWVRGGRTVIDRLTHHKANADLGSPLLDQAVAARLIPQLPDLAKARSRTARRRLAHVGSLLADQLPQWRWREPDGGSALWVELPDTDAAVFAQVALRHGVEVVPGAATDPSGAWDAYLRLPFTFEPDVLTEVVRRLERAWSDLHRHGPLPTASGPHTI